MPVEQPVFADAELQSETWRSIPGYEDLYQVSSLARVYSERTERILRVGRLSRGRRRYKISLNVNGVERWYLLHQLVALAFLGPCPEGKETNHIDGNPLNCRPENLEYVTPEENREHALRTGILPSGDNHYTRRCPEKVMRGEKNGMSKLTDAQRDEIYRRRSQGEKLVPLAHEFGVHLSIISRIFKPRKRKPKS